MNLPYFFSLQKIKVASKKIKICSIEGCNRPYVAKGFCNKHWHINRRNFPVVSAQNKKEGKLETNNFVSKSTSVS